MGVLAALQAVRAPFGGIGGAVVPMLGFGRWAGNPAICTGCSPGFRKKGFDGGGDPGNPPLRRHPRLDRAGRANPAGRVQTLASMRFYRDRLGRRSSATTGSSTSSSATRSSALFIPASPATTRRPRSRRRSARRRVGRRMPRPAGPIPVGIGVHGGESYVGIVGPAGALEDFTALGDPSTRRPGWRPGRPAGEILVSVAAAEAADYETKGRERRNLEVRGRPQPIDVGDPPLSVACDPVPLATRGQARTAEI